MDTGDTPGKISKDERETRAMVSRQTLKAVGTREGRKAVAERLKKGRPRKEMKLTAGLRDPA